MAASTDPSPVTEARRTLRAKRVTLMTAIHQEADTAGKLADLLRQHDPGHPDVVAAKSAHDTAVGALATARTEERDARTALKTAIDTWFKDGTTVIDQVADIGRLQADNPVVLLPVRVETRFESGPPLKLKVRIYPDEIFLDVHERALTPAEFAAGQAYYQGWPIDEATERQRWRDLAGRFGPNRAAYIARVMRPVLPRDTDPYGGKVCDDNWLSETPKGDATVFQRPDAWTRPGEAVLPDRWMVSVYRGGKLIKTKVGALVPEPLFMTPNPDPNGTNTTIDGFEIDADLLWTVDYATAEQIGMAITFDTGDDSDLTQGYDKLLVIGVKGSMTPFENATTEEPLDAPTHLEKLLDAQHYSRGMAVVPQGTATNNTEGSPSAFPPEDPFFDNSFDTERFFPPFHRSLSYHCMPPTFSGQEKDIDLLGRALGVPNGVFRNVWGAAKLVSDGEGGAQSVLSVEQLRARLMNEALWPATWGYFLTQMMDPVLKNNLTAVDDARDYFRSYVRGRGPAPAFRIGAVPYGVLPAISLAHWEKRGTVAAANLEDKIVTLLRVLREHWKQASSKVSRIDPTASQPYDTLLAVLAQGASAQQIRIRNIKGKDTVSNEGAMLGQDVVAALQRMEDTANFIVRMIRHVQWLQARVLRMEVAATSSVFPDPLVTADGLLGPAAYIRRLVNATREELRDDTIFPAGGPKPLLYMLVRHALLSEYARLLRKRTPSPLRPTEIELFGIIDLVIDDKKFWDVLTQPLLDSVKSEPEAVAYLKNLGDLANEIQGQPTVEVERLLTETLDVSSHRLDAWITAFATHRLTDIRLAQEPTRFKPAGSYLGGYAWVENVRKGPVLPANGGYIHAPSLPQAAAAALLRSGFQSGQLEAKSKYAIDLSSDRVRTARRLLDEVREGQPLGAVLGYRFERALRERNLARMEEFIGAFRKLYPLVANKSGQDPNQPADKVAARNVVDGLVTRTKFKANLIPFGQQGLPGPNGTAEEKAAHAAIVDELKKLDGTIDAVGDLVTAESVYQVVRGNVAGAGANLDALARGLRPPDPEIARSPRAGTGVTHRVALAWDGDLGDPTGWFTSTDPTKYSQRKKRAGQLDNFLGRLLGDVSSVKATVSYKKPNDDQVDVEVFLGPRTGKTSLSLRPIDVIALARAATRPNEGSLLDRHLRAAALDGVSSFKDVTVTYDTTGLTFPQVLEMARAIGTAFAGMRPLIPDDLLLPGESSGDAPLVSGEGARAMMDAAKEARTRLDVDSQALKDAVQILFEDLEEDGDLDDPSLADDVRDALRAAATYAPTAFPDPADSPRQLITAGNEIAAELDRRSAAAKASIDAEGGSSMEVSRLALAAFQSIFGRDFLTTSKFTAPNHAELERSLGTQLLVAGDESAPSKMLEQMARVRDNLGRVRRVALYAEALATERPQVALMQLPFLEGELWVGPRKGPIPAQFPQNRISFVVLVPTGAEILDSTGLTDGLLIDEWVEMVPATKEETGVAFHYDNPGAEAPQAVLVAVPPKANGKWTFAQLLATVDETFDLAHLRMVEREQLPSEQALPVTYISHNLDNAVPSTDFARLADDPVIIE